MPLSSSHALGIGLERDRPIPDSSPSPGVWRNLTRVSQLGSLVCSIADPTCIQRCRQLLQRRAWRRRLPQSQHPLRMQQVFQRALLRIFYQLRNATNRLRIDAFDNHPRQIRLAGDHHFTGQIRRRSNDSRQLLDLGQRLTVVGKAAIATSHDHVRVRTQDLAFQILLKPRHHAQHRHQCASAQKQSKGRDGRKDRQLPNQLHEEADQHRH